MLVSGNIRPVRRIAIGVVPATKTMKKETPKKYFVCPYCHKKQYKIADVEVGSLIYEYDFENGNWDIASYGEFEGEHKNWACPSCGQNINFKKVVPQHLIKQMGY